MKIKQIIAMILSITLTAGILTGCAKSDEEKAKEQMEENAESMKEMAK